MDNQTIKKLDREIKELPTKVCYAYKFLKLLCKARIDYKLIDFNSYLKG